MRLRLLLLAVLLAGCAAPDVGDGGVARSGDVAQPGDEAAPSSGGDPTAPPFAPRDTGFPVDAKPRPIVLIGSPLQVDKGFATDEEKIAVGAGNFTLVGTPPETPGPQPVALPDGPATLPVVGATDAVRAMSTGPGEDPAPVKLVEAVFGTADFPTDRGRLALPAWRFRTEAGSLLMWPAPSPSAFWTLGLVTRSSVGNSATESGNGLEVVLPSAPEPCPGDAPAVNEAVAVESELSVTVSVRTDGEVGECPRTDALKFQPYRVELAEPLGARLLMDTGGGVIPVTKK